jgi:MbtH protein
MAVSLELLLWECFFKKTAKELSMNEDTENLHRYKIVVNDEEQYSIWPADKPDPLGWRDINRVGTSTECLDYIQQAWPDIRPLSVRSSIPGNR